MSDKKVKELRKKVQDLLTANKMFYDFSVDSNGYIEITVENGDWKHDHIALRNLMRDSGFVFLGRYVPDEENSDDSFSAIYLYR